jgi:HrpA-like RNA helicase
MPTAHKSTHYHFQSEGFFFLYVGKCYRLYTEQYFLTKMHNFTLPEIMRSDISFLVLYLLSLGIDNFLTKFDLPAPIPSNLLISALSKLFYLQAIDINGKLTDDYGIPMAELLPLDPMLSRLVIHSTKVIFISVLNTLFIPLGVIININ